MNKYILLVAPLFAFWLTSALAAPLADSPPTIPKARTTEYLRTAGKDPARVAAYDELVAQLLQLKDPAPLPVLVDKAGLDAESQAAVEKKSAGVLSVSEFLRLRNLAGGYALGISGAGQLGQYQMWAERQGLVHWEIAYAQFGIDWRVESNHTEEFMEKIAGTGRPLVMFLPHDVFGPKGEYTKKEVRWLLAHEKALARTYFVYGAYDLVTKKLEKLREKAGLSKDEFRALFLRAVGMAKPSQYESDDQFLPQ